MNQRFRPIPVQRLGALASIACFLLLLSFPLPSIAQSTMINPIIVAALPNYTTKPPTLTITGADFGLMQPKITINYLSAGVVSYSNNQVVLQITAAGLAR